jgi:hypothetical protein
MRRSRDYSNLETKIHQYEQSLQFLTLNIERLERIKQMILHDGVGEEDPRYEPIQQSLETHQEQKILQETKLERLRNRLRNVAHSVLEEFPSLSFSLFSFFHVFFWIYDGISSGFFLFFGEYSDSFCMIFHSIMWVWVCSVWFKKLKIFWSFFHHIILFIQKFFNKV